MSLEGCDLLGGIVVIDSQLEVIRTADDPILARNEASSPNRDIGEFEGFDNCLEAMSIDHCGRPDELPESRTTRCKRVRYRAWSRSMVQWGESRSPSLFRS